MKKTILKTAIAATLGAAVAMPAQAAVNTFNYDGIFTMLDPNGAALANSSLTAKGANQFQTPINGTLSFDTATGSGTGTVVPFQFFGGDPALPAEAVGIEMSMIGDGAGGAGSLILGNMLFNWNGNNGIPVSIVMDAQGFFANDLDGTAGAGTLPASDGTYVNPTVGVTGPGGYPGYLGLGPVPISTTAFNTTNASNCSAAVEGDPSTGCMGVSPSGFLPLVTDTKANANDFVANTGGTIGGSPFVDGPFTGFNPNFDITGLTFASQDPNGSIGPFAVSEGTPEVPVPAAVWLFGSGLLGLVGVARRKKSNV